MVSQPDLFVVCKNCGSEVSPYVTECPYCGQRVRKRAPKLDRSGEDAEPRLRQRRRPRLSRMRADEIEGIAPETRPNATIVVIVVSLLVSLVLATQEVGPEDLGGIFLGVFDEPWRYATASFVHVSLGYQFVALVATGVFGSLLERRFGPVALLVVFLGAGAAGMAAAAAASLSGPLGEARIEGANAAALGLLAAWLVDDRRAARRGEERESDLIGVYVFAAVLLALPIAVEEASVVAGLAGAAAGTLLAFVLPALTRRR